MRVGRPLRTLPDIDLNNSPLKRIFKWWNSLFFFLSSDASWESFFNPESLFWIMGEFFSLKLNEATWHAWCHAASRSTWVGPIISWLSASLLWIFPHIIHYIFLPAANGLPSIAFSGSNGPGAESNCHVEISWSFKLISPGCLVLPLFKTWVLASILAP